MKWRVWWVAQLRYLLYVVKHKAHVYVAGLKLGVPRWQLVIHDWSKFGRAEWEAYYRHFYTEPEVGEKVYGVADGHGWEGVVLRSRPAKTGSPGLWGKDYFIHDAENGYEGWIMSYEVLGRSGVDLAFDQAWLHHIHSNPHHWQHWMLQQDSGDMKILRMPERYVREMVADWVGASMALGQGSDIRPWLGKSINRMRLHPHTKQRVAELVGHLYGLPS